MYATAKSFIMELKARVQRRMFVGGAGTQESEAGGDELERKPGTLINLITKRHAHDHPVGRVWGVRGQLEGGTKVNDNKQLFDLVWKRLLAAHLYQPPSRHPLSTSSSLTYVKPARQQMMMKKTDVMIRAGTIRGRRAEQIQTREREKNVRRE